MKKGVSFSKYHALGNDYIVLDPADVGEQLTGDEVRRICDRHHGVGSDGILFGPLEAPGADFQLRIFNPDGSEAEKSGNGLRIFARYLWDRSLVQDRSFTILTAGGKVAAQVHAGGRTVDVDMGKVSFWSDDIPVTGPSREVINETIEVGGEQLTFCAATVGNPHCVIRCDEVTEELVQRWGPTIEVDPRFPNRTNVQLMKILDRSSIRIEIWERGAGRTLASGSSSSAAAAVARKLGYCDSEIAVHMPGGKIDVRISDDLLVSIRGSVTQVAEGRLASEMFE